MKKDLPKIFTSVVEFASPNLFLATQVKLPSSSCKAVNKNSVSWQGVDVMCILSPLKMSGFPLNNHSMVDAGLL